MNQNSPFTVYTASAGSGKTFALVKAYLERLFTTPHPEGFKHILAITFTNKAVAEMKTRIIEGLIELTQYEEGDELSAMQHELCASLNTKAIALKKKATNILERILHNYAAFSVETIDSFNHRLLRTFSKDLGLQSNFEVTLEAPLLLSQAVDRFVSQAGSDAKITKAYRVC